MADSHSSASLGNGATRADAGGMSQVERDEIALGFECADPRLQIESWAPDLPAQRGTAESSWRPG